MFVVYYVIFPPMLISVYLDCFTRITTTSGKDEKRGVVLGKSRCVTRGEGTRKGSKVIIIVH